MGCSGHSNPASPDNSDVIGRRLQSFDNPIAWEHPPGVNETYSLDSSTSTWTNPVPMGYTMGDIATEYGDANLPVTAFVRHDSPVMQSRIEIVLVDGDQNQFFMREFSYAQDSGEIQQDYEFARHPAVEVTYRLADEGPILGVNIVWGEYLGYEEDAQWEIAYRYLEFSADEQGEWNTPPDVDEWQLVYNIPWAHETQPDLCVDYLSGDLYGACKVELCEMYQWGIFAARLQRNLPDPQWEILSPVAQVDGDQKDFPSIDAGRFREATPEAAQWPTDQVAVVWSRLHPGAPEPYYKVYYNDWALGNAPDSTEAMVISENVSIESAILPKVEVMPYSSGLYQGLSEAVITWAHHPFTPDHWVPYVMMVATPFIGPDYPGTAFRVDGFSNRCPDLSPYQGAEAGPGKGLVALATHYREEQEDTFIVRAATYSISTAQEEFVFSWEQEATVECVPQWVEANPFTGPSICLRNPDPPGWATDTFALGWVEQGYYAYLAEGDTTR